MWERFKLKCAQFMSGRYGADELGLCCLIVALAVDIIGRLCGTGLLLIPSFALYVWTIYRIFSRNIEKRQAENAKYQAIFGNVTKEIRQFFIRLKNSREYKYFRCPGCRARMRMKRGSGERHIVCPKCRKEFDKKA